MNVLQIKVAELQKCGKDLMSELLTLSDRHLVYEASKGKYEFRREARNNNPEQLSRDLSQSRRIQWRQEETEVLHVLDVLRGILRGIKPSPADLSLLQNEVNKPAQLSAYVLPSSRRCLLTISRPSLRRAIERLIRYTEMVAEDTRLSAYEPFGICPKCDALFVKGKRNQKTCSPKCRFEVWRETNPFGRDYWKPDKNLARKKKRAAARSHGQKPSTQTQKAGVKSGVEFSGKAGEPRGKSGKR